MKKIWFVAFAYWIVMSALICWLYPLMVFDSIGRYAPMADAFARGEWNLAFHPRFGVIFPPLTGALVWLLGIQGDHACQIVSTAMLAFSAIPVWAIAKHVFGDEKVAWVSTLLLLIATEYLTYIEDGLRDPGRTLGIALCALAFLNGRSWIMALGIFILSMIKVDLYAFSCVMLFVWWIVKIVKHESGWFVALLAPTGSWLAGTIFMCTMTYSLTGYFLPLMQFVRLYVKLTKGVEI